MKTLIVLIASLFGTFVSAQYSPQQFPIIPKPQLLLPLGGEFAISNAVTIVVDNKSLKKECETFRKQAKQLYNLDLRYGKLSGFEPCIFISLDSTGLPPEGYELFVNRDGINLYGSRAGIFYGLQSILQLIQTGAKPNALVVPSCSIIDYPRFAWRGMHLDVARHFFPKENVKDYLRWMAMYKLNTFHWHLTDDQGWRIEILKYPNLTTIGAWRKHTLVGHFSEEPDVYDDVRYGGFYTQAEAKEIVRFADSLHITVVPEIEMPGHASAMLAAYPHLGNSYVSYEVQGTWGVFNEVLYPSDTTFAFLENVLTEVAGLFPGKYIHIGGDECPKTEWENSMFCQNQIRKYALNGEEGLQSWFVQHIVRFLETKGKKAIGWDEILEGGLADGAAIMSWRGEDGGIAAAKAGHNVVMTPGSHCYFDYYQSKNTGEPLAIGGYLPIEKVYSYDPVPASLSKTEKQFIMGVQANLWTEYIPDFRQVQYMIFPRIAALSEVAWSNGSLKEYDNFVPRINAHMVWYDKMKLNYSRAMFEIKPQYQTAAIGSGIALALSSVSKSCVIRFTRGGTELSGSDSVYAGPITIRGNETIIAAVYDGNKRVSPFFNQSFEGHKAFGAKVTLRKPPAPAYNTGGAMTLTDGITGRKPWTGAEWLGWWGDTLDAVIDLGKVDTIRSVEVITLRDEGSWIYRPQKVAIYLSTDGINFTLSEDESVLRPNQGNTFQTIFLSGKQVRFVKVIATGKGVIPENSPGAGYPAWLFVSEIIVK